MPNHNMSIHNKSHCDKAGCICITTKGKSCTFICKNEKGDITRCADCKCTNCDTCECKCDDSKCSCIVTKGSDVICGSHGERGNIKACNCACVETKNKRCCESKANAKPCECCIKKSEKNNGCDSCKCDKKKETRRDEDRSCCCVEVKYKKCCKKELFLNSCKCCKEEPEKRVCGDNNMCDEKREYKGSRHIVSTSKNYKCNGAECIFIPTGGKSCICVCENENGDIMRCDDCKCLSSETCRCKCDESRCICLITKGAEIICVSRDDRGNIKACDCSCVDTRNKRCSELKVSSKDCGCCTKEPKEKDCCDNFKFHKKEEMHRNKGCSSCCDENIGAACCKKELSFKFCKCCIEKPEKKACGDNCKCAEEPEYKELRHVVSAYKNYKCDKVGCFFMPTGGKYCICVCENENGDIIRCDDCKCLNSDTCQPKCDDSRCTCIDTKGADIICVRRDERGNIKACDCSCIEAKNVKCCKKEVNLVSCRCCSTKFEKQDCCHDCKCDRKNNYEKIRRDEERNVKDRKCCCDKVTDATCCRKELTFMSC